MKINGKEIKINRANAVISEVDTAYCELLQHILKDGVRTNNRTGIDTIAIANWQHIFDLSKGFPIMETKKVNAKNFASEIQWIHQVQSNEVQWLRDRDNPVWDQWVVDEDGIYRIYEQGENAVHDPEREVICKKQVFNPENGEVEKVTYIDENGNKIMVKPFTRFDEKGNELTIKDAIYFGKQYAGTIGEAYGYINNLYKMPQCVEYRLKNNPTDRRMIINLWQNAHLPNAVLPSCVFLDIFKTTPDGKLHSNVTQRSADVPKGVPFNFAQYALIHHMFAKANGYEVGTMAWNIQDTHIYVNQLEGIKKQIQRYKYMQEYSKIIQEKSDVYIEDMYENLEAKFNKVHEFVRGLIDTNDLDSMPFPKRIKSLKQDHEDIAKEYEEYFERKLCLEHMLTRETPVLELAEHESFFDYSTEYVKKGDPYLEENPIGNKELVLKNYHTTPFISMPIAQ